MFSVELLPSVVPIDRLIRFRLLLEQRNHPNQIEIRTLLPCRRSRHSEQTWQFVTGGTCTRLNSVVIHNTDFNTERRQ
jgi:hypothetical protein